MENLKYIFLVFLINLIIAEVDSIDLPYGCSDCKIEKRYAKDYKLCNPSKEEKKINCEEGYYILDGGAPNSRFVERDDTTGTLWECKDDGTFTCAAVEKENIPYGYLKNQYVETEAPYIICYLENENKNNPICRAMLGEKIKSSTNKGEGENAGPVCTEKGQLGIASVIGTVDGEKIDYYSSTYFFCNDKKEKIVLVPNDSNSNNVDGQYFIGYDENARRNGETYRSVQTNENGIYSNVFEIKMLNDDYSGKEFFFRVDVSRPNVVLSEPYTGNEYKYLFTASGDETLKIFVKGQCPAGNLNQFVKDHQGTDTVDYYYMIEEN